MHQMYKLGQVSMFKVVQTLIGLTGDDPNREGLRETPERFTKAWQFWTSGYDQNPADVLKTFEQEKHDELIFQGQLPFFSLCEHHLTPFFGMACIGYIPNGRIVGLSKLSRLLDIYARRLTIQERITTLVADDLMKHLNARGVGVVLHARHLCMESRGISRVGTITMTSAIRGCLDQVSTRSEFMTLVAASMGGVTRP
jgi:GTP cyclohydrolase I